MANFSEKEDFSPRYRISLYKKNEKLPFLSIGLQSDRSANILEWEWAVDIKATYGGVASYSRQRRLRGSGKGTLVRAVM